MDGGYPSDRLDDHRCRACGHVWKLRHLFDGGPGGAYVPIRADCPNCGYNTWTCEPELVGPPEPLANWWQRISDAALLRALTAVAILFLATAAYAGPDVYTVVPAAPSQVTHSKDGTFDPPVLIMQYPAAVPGRIQPLPGPVGQSDPEPDEDDDDE